MKKTILITGGAGFIGSILNKMLYQKGYETVIFDNLSHASCLDSPYGHFYQGDICNSSDLENLFQTYRIDAVIHLAALIDVRESVNSPAQYYQVNVGGFLQLLNAIVRFHIPYFVFSSSAAVYGYPQKIPIPENAPLNPINPYGKTKLMGEMILDDYHSATDLRYISLRYFNAAGGDPEGKIKACKRKESNLIPKILQSLLAKQTVTIFGDDYPTPDGTCIRDYIHVYDLGMAHILALEALFNEASSSVYNLGNGNGFSVKEVIAAAEIATGKKADICIGKRREGDPPILLADSEKAKEELGWNPQYPKIETMIEHAWKSLETGELET